MIVPSTVNALLGTLLMPATRWIRAAVLALVMGAAGQREGFAWNGTGHRVIASIAYRELDDATRQAVADLLHTHPAYADLWAKRPTNGPDERLNLFWNASIFPDEARRPPWDRFNRPKAHYVDYRIFADRGNTVEPPVEGEDVLNSYVAHLAAIRNARTPAADKALHLSWVFHQAGDIHQPLHAVARFSKTFPEPYGDKGGNEVIIPNPHARGERGNNLHAYWDDLLGTNQDPTAIEELAGQLMSQHPRAAFAEELKKDNIARWAEESVAISLKTAYNNLDPNIKQFADRPVGYDADAKAVARRRATLAGYRLADELKRLGLSR